MWWQRSRGRYTRTTERQINERREDGSLRSQRKKIRQRNSRGALQAPGMEKADLKIHFFRDLHIPVSDSF